MFREQAELYLAILGDRQLYHTTSKNYKTLDVKNDFLQKDNVISVLFDWNEKGYTTWLSINDKETDCIEGVTALCDFWLDIDARPRGIDERVASKEELEAALERTNKLKIHLETKYGATGFIANSGNGFHLHFPLPRFDIPLELRKQVNNKLRIFAKNSARIVGAEIDNTYDISRRTTLIGTLNKKIPEQPLQTSWSKELFEEGLEAALKLVEDARTQNQTLLDSILSTEEPKINTLKVQPKEKHLDIEQLTISNPKVNDLLKAGDWKKYEYKSRSEGEQALLTILAMEGYSDDEIREVMESCAIGKWQEKNEGYRRLSLEHARVQAAIYIKEQESITETMDKMKQTTTTVETPSELDTEAYDLAEENIEKFCFKTMADTDEIYYYDNGVYKPNGERIIADEVEKQKPECTIHFVNEVLGHVRRGTHVNREDFDSNPYLLSLSNCILNIRTGETTAFTPTHLSLIRIPASYDKDAKCEAIDKFLTNVVSPQDIKTLYEIAGFLLLKRYFIHKAVMLVGDTHSGKSTYIKLLSALLGKENMSNQSLQNLLTNRFAPAQLYGKLMNAFADLPNSALRQSGTFKILCGEDRLSAEKKGKDPFEFENTAKLIFSCNEMPRTYDKGDAFYIRWILINFPNRFDDKNSKTDKKLIEKLTTKEELSGFLNKAIESAKTLISQEHFSNNPDVEEIREYYEKLSNPIYAFIKDLCIQDGEANILCEEFYQRLMLYCEEKRLSKPTLTFVTQDLKRLRIEKTRLSDGKKPYAYHGLRWKTDEENTEDKTLEDY